MTEFLRLGVNIDHVATIRNARGGAHPDPLKAANIATVAGADGITAHLREDRRHISDADIARLRAEIDVPLNLEMAVTEEMGKIALRHKPNACCLVPEKREEITTEGGLDIAGNNNRINDFSKMLQEQNILVSLFIDPDEVQIRASADVGADIIELHAGSYAHAVISGDQKLITHELEKLCIGAELGHKLGLEVHAGHGLTFDSVAAVAALPQIVELNIGHFLIGEAIFIGLDASIKKMRHLMDKARATLG
ncbi:MAG: pyridoxine 5'-phosphate synthase [Hyphomicrobiales bacterium]|nr:MAG: pyridoxine 5'-phosphate synthase [Hyphomicrobiales bacterium]